MNRAVIPTVPLLKRLNYVRAAHTDITVGWRKLGWLPKAERDAEIKAQAAAERANSKGVKHVV